MWHSHLVMNPSEPSIIVKVFPLVNRALANVVDSMLMLCRNFVWLDPSKNAASFCGGSPLIPASARVLRRSSTLKRYSLCSLRVSLPSPMSRSASVHLSRWGSIFLRSSGRSSRTLRNKFWLRRFLRLEMPTCSLFSRNQVPDAKKVLSSRSRSFRTGAGSLWPTFWSTCHPKPR